MAATLFFATLVLAKFQDPQAAFQAYDLPVGLTVSLPAKPDSIKADKGEDRKAFVSYGDDAIYFVSDAPIPKDEQKEFSADQQIAAYIFAALREKKDRHLVKYSDILLDGW